MPKQVLNIEQVAIVVGMSVPAVRKQTGKGGFPVPSVEGGAGRFWDADAIEKYVDARDAEPAKGLRFESGPFASKHQCQRLLRLMHRQGINGRVTLYPKSGEYYVAIPVTAEMADKTARDLKELFKPAFQLISADDWLDIGETKAG